MPEKPRHPSNPQSDGNVNALRDNRSLRQQAPLAPPGSPYDVMNRPGSVFPGSAQSRNQQSQPPRTQWGGPPCGPNYGRTNPNSRAAKPGQPKSGTHYIRCTTTNCCSHGENTWIPQVWAIDTPNIDCRVCHYRFLDDAQAHYFAALKLGNRPSGPPPPYTHQNGEVSENCGIMPQNVSQLPNTFAGSRNPFIQRDSRDSQAGPGPSPRGRGTSAAP